MSLPLVFALLIAPECLQIPGARISVADLKTVIPSLSALDDAIEFGYAPLPGSTRWIRKAELSAFLARHGLDSGSTSEICVTREAQTLTHESVQAAVVRAVGRICPDTDAQVEILDYLRLPLPKGEIELVAQDLRANSKDTVVWRGRIHHEHHRSVAVWVKARILVARQSWFARMSIPRGRVIAGDDLEAKIVPVPLMEAIRTEEQTMAVGSEAACDILQGQRIVPKFLTRPLSIRRGDAVRAVSEVGGVRLTIDAKARQSGRAGDAISIENSANRRIFRALVTAPGSVQVLHEVNENDKNRSRGVAARAQSAGGPIQESRSADTARSAH